MQFENPWLLTGMLAAAIPIVIHLINRRKAPIVEFAAMTFILHSNQRLAQRLKLKQLLVLALRILLIAAIPFALAQPYTVPDDAFSSDTPTSIVFVIDNSLSMSFQHEDSTRLDMALDKAEEVLEQLDTESNVGIVIASFPALALTPELIFDRALARKTLQEIRETDQETDMSGALRAAEALLTQSNLAKQQVVILSDLQKSSWTELDEPWALETPPLVETINIAPDHAPSNTAVADVVVERATEVSAQHVRVVASITAYGDDSFRDTVYLKMGDLRAHRSIQVPAGETRSTSFLVKVESSGIQTGEVYIDEDALKTDNRRLFHVRSSRTIQALVVNGAPRTIPYRDEIFFLEKALKTHQNAEKIHTLVRKSEEISPIEISGADVIILANVLSLPEEAIPALQEFVSKGGGLLITAGDNVTEDYNRWLGDLLPLPIRAVKKSAKGRTDKDKNRTLQLEKVETSHPIFRVFTNLRDASLYRTHFNTYLLLDGTGRAGDQTSVIASYINGTPFLVEKKIGQGMVMLMTSSIDKDWNDLPIRTSFLPLVQQTVFYLAQRIQKNGGALTQVGHPLSLQLQPGTTQVVVTRPNGEIDSMSPNTQKNDRVIRYEKTNLAGLYSFEEANGDNDEIHVSYISVIPNPSESEVEAITLAEAEKTLQTDNAVESQEPTGRVSNTHSQRNNIWPYVLAGLFFLLASEAILVIRD